MLQIELQAAHSGYDRVTCFVHARAAAIPGDPPAVVITMHPLRLTGCDVFYEIYDMRTDDGGKTWTTPRSCKDTLGRRPVEGGVEEGVCDFVPQWHAKSGMILATGQTNRYVGDNIQPHPRPQSTAYSVYDPAQRTWSHWKKLTTPEPEKFFKEGAGSTQRVDLDNGEILLPTYVGQMDTFESKYHVEGY